jgi:hypothetical protein
VVTLLRVASTDYRCGDRGKVGELRGDIGATVKASNFEPHGNFGPFLARFVPYLGVFVPKMNQLRKSTVCLQLLFHSFLCRTRFVKRKSF